MPKTVLRAILALVARRALQAEIPAPRAASETPTVTPWPAAVLHLDLDAFFVGVYLLDHPADRGRPLAVAGGAQERGVITSASYEARAFGVRAGMPTRRALGLCPKLKVVRADWERIRTSSQEVMAILRRYGPTEPTSVDEAYVDLSAAQDPALLAAEIRDRVVQETGLGASVGLGTSRLVAKVASDQAKPGGCVVVPPGEEANFLAPLPAKVIPGIGPRTAERLAGLGIRTCAELARADPERLAQHLGRHAAQLPLRALGLGSAVVRPDRGPPKSISGERTFDRDVTAPDELLREVAAQSARVARRLQLHAMAARTVFVRFRWADFTTFTRQRSFGMATNDAEYITAVAQALWLAHWPPGQPVRLVGVGVANLEPAAGRQLGLDLC